MRILFAALLIGSAGASAHTPILPTHGSRRTPDGTLMTPKVAQVLAGRFEGKSQSCVRLRDVRSTRIVDESAIVYELSRKRWLVNFPEGGCPSLRSDRVLVTRTPSGDLCRGDIVRVLDPPAPIEYGACGLDEFVPYTLDRPAR